MIRRMEPVDVPAVVAVHLQSFPGFFLSFLGARFLSLYYSGICTAPEGIALVYLNGKGAPAGFVAGTANPRGFYGRLLKRDGMKFALASLGALFRRPTVLFRLLRALTHPSDNPVGEDVAGLYSIGVLPELQGTGAGKKLVQAFLDQAAARGCRRVFLTTDRDNNEPVNGFYHSLGFSIEQQYVTPERRRMNQYWISLADRKQP